RNGQIETVANLVCSVSSIDAVAFLDLDGDGTADVLEIVTCSDGKHALILLHKVVDNELAFVEPRNLERKLSALGKAMSVATIKAAIRAGDLPKEDYDPDGFTKTPPGHPMPDMSDQ